ncbi:transferrin [Phymastichus coffea]|uniref:transferrin n=1 Tax=Phymastichus coffea TaxID=108790 RepID=UPI00273CEB0B|nr:transferrin [Phymastichus coffea]
MIIRRIHMAARGLWAFLAITSLAFNRPGVEADPLRFCATSRRLSRTNEALRRTCSELKSNSADINCVIADDRLSCLRLLANGLADFTVLEPEDLTILGNGVLDHDDLLVTHELKLFADNQPQYDTEMVAVVKNRFNNDWVTKDKRLCYIGFEVGYQPNYHYHYTSYFERWLINKDCDPRLTSLENRITDLSSHFGSACIAGPWSLDAAYDGELKSKYKNLCALCGNPSGCFAGDRFYGMQGALQCLLEGLGDVAWLSRAALAPHSKELADDGFSLLCPDGMFLPLSTNKSCAWIAEPRASLVARSEAAERVRQRTSGKSFYPVIHASYEFSHLASLAAPVAPEDYAQRFQGYLSSRLSMPCRPERDVRWCLASGAEASKCGWMQAAAAAVGVEPAVSCVQQRDRVAALEAVRDGRCDVYVARPEEEALARGMRLRPVAHIVGSRDLEASRVAAIVRKDARFRSLAELRGASACFPGYRSVGWNAFFALLRNSSAAHDCSDARAISQFFNRSCVLGLSAANSSLPANLYSLCEQARLDEKLGPDENAFKCLMSGADVAFVNVHAAKKYYSAFSIFRMNYKLLCQDELRSAEQCFLAETTLGSVLVSSNVTRTREQEIFLMLLSLDRFFGKTLDRETAMFTLYGPYEGQSDVIFPDRTRHLQRHATDVRNGRTYEEILQSLQDHVECGAGSGGSARSAAADGAAIVALASALWGLLRLLL